MRGWAGAPDFQLHDHLPELSFLRVLPWGVASGSVRHLVGARRGLVTGGVLRMKMKTWEVLTEPGHLHSKSLAAKILRGWNPPVQRAGHPKAMTVLPAPQPPRGPLLPSQCTVWG